MNTIPGPDLRDIHLPAPPTWWPPAPGWWMLAIILLAGSLAAIYKIIQMQRRRRLRRAVIGELDRCIAAAPDGAPLAAALSQFLRRLALRDKPAAAALQGEAWLAYLDERLGDSYFSAGIGRVLLDAPFRPSASIDAPALVALVRRWTRSALHNEVRRA